MTHPVFDDVFAAPGLWIQRCEVPQGGFEWFAYSQGVGTYYSTSEELLGAFQRSDVSDWLTRVNATESEAA